MVESYLVHVFIVVMFQCDLVYTFFHPMLRDEQDIDKTNLHKLKGLLLVFTPKINLYSDVSPHLSERPVAH